MTVIVSDTNLLLYAYREEVPLHDHARDWWESILNGVERVGIPWTVVSAFVRMMTNRSVYSNAIMPTEAFDYVSEWFESPNVGTINPGTRHLALFRRNLEAAGIGGNLVTDAHVAALAMEYQGEVHTSDRDFARFPGLRWRNPI